MNAPAARPTFRTYLNLVKFEHTVFALPFAYAGLLASISSIRQANSTGSA